MRSKLIRFVNNTNKLKKKEQIIVVEEVLNVEAVALKEKEIGPLTILFGKENGKYPHGNSLLIKGSKKNSNC